MVVDKLVLRVVKKVSLAVVGVKSIVKLVPTLGALVDNMTSSVSLSPCTTEKLLERSEHVVAAPVIVQVRVVFAAFLFKVNLMVSEPLGAKSLTARRVLNVPAIAIGVESKPGASLPRELETP